MANRAIATWRNSLVFHSLDKVISLAIHIFPPFVFTTIVHFYPNPHERYPALASPNLSIATRPWRSIAISLAAYLVWQILYFRYVVVARAEKIKQGRATSFTFMINDKKRLIGKIAAKVPSQYRESAFMVSRARVWAELSRSRRATLTFPSLATPLRIGRSTHLHLRHTPHPRFRPLRLEILVLGLPHCRLRRERLERRLLLPRG